MQIWSKMPAFAGIFDSGKGSIRFQLGGVLTTRADVAQDFFNGRVHGSIDEGKTILLNN